MKLLLCADDGTILDSTDPFSREEWENLSAVGAALLLDELSPGDERD